MNGQNNPTSGVKTFINILLVLVQISLIFFTISELNSFSKYCYGLLELFAILVVLFILYSKEKYTSKLSWSLFILIFPISGFVFYILWGRIRTPRKTEDRIYQIHEETFDLLKQDKKILDEISDPIARKQVDLLNNLSGFPACVNTRTQYLKTGETMFSTLTSELQAAKRFIFLEFFILSDGSMLDEIMKILVERAGEGIEVRIIYDEAGSFRCLPANFRKFCRSNKIKCASFNPFSNSLYNFANFRDHRKIAVIDGNVAIAGGSNVGDEYINEKERFGHWKDMALMIRGEAVWNFTVMFLRMWDFVTSEESNYAKFVTTINYHEERGIVLPFGDGPMYRLNPSENIYMKMISSAVEYVYITTPYLVLDNDMITVISLAARSGVDVRIITPHIPDKKFVQATTRSFYGDLLEQGVRIYEYTPGFIHGKTVVSDDKFSLVGSINFDYRSLFWNFECGTWVYDTDTAKAIRADFVETLQSCQEITYEEWSRKNIFSKFYCSILQIISPLL